MSEIHKGDVVDTPDGPGLVVAFAGESPVVLPGDVAKVHPLTDVTLKHPRPINWKALDD